jgi:PAS domain S-box-containing protein
MWRQQGEIIAQSLAIAVGLWLVFGIDATAAAKFFYLLFLPLIWISVRHGAPGAAFALLGIQLGIIIAVQAEGYASATVLEFQLLMLALAVTGLFLGTMVSDRRRARETLEAREAELASVFDTAPDGILVLGEDGRVLRANETAGTIFASQPSLLVGRRIAELLPDVVLGNTPFAHAEYTAIRRDGARFPAELAIGRADVVHPLYIAILRDVTAQKEMETQLRERESELARSLRIAAAAETAGALAHELNQPLSAIATYVRACTLLLDRAEANRDRLVQTMNTVVAEVGRAGEIVRRLRDFFRSGTSRLEPATVADLVQGAVALLAPRFARHHIELAVEIEPELPQVLVDRLQIDTVLHNLLANAVDALKSVEAGQRRITVQAALSGSAVRITVSDTGPGFPPELATGVFRPFTTNKPEGMGLGLAISRSIVENHGGRLTTEPTDRGAALSFTLPAGIAAEAAP